MYFKSNPSKSVVMFWWDQKVSKTFWFIYVVVVFPQSWPHQDLLSRNVVGLAMRMSLPQRWYHPICDQHCTTIKLCCNIFLADCRTNVHLCVKQKFSAYSCPIILCWEKHARALPNCQKKCLFAHIVIKNKSTGRSALCQLDV